MGERVKSEDKRKPGANFKLYFRLSFSISVPKKLNDEFLKVSSSKELKKEMLKELGVTHERDLVKENDAIGDIVKIELRNEVLNQMRLNPKKRGEFTAWAREIMEKIIKEKKKE